MFEQKSAILRLLRDDGAVVYLNGSEVFRTNMPTGAISYSTLASTTVVGADESAFVSVTLNPSLLVDPTQPWQRRGDVTREIGGQRVPIPYAMVFHASAWPLTTEAR